MNLSTRNHIVSALTTFVTVFCVYLIQNIGSVDVSTVDTAAVLGLLLAAVRAGAKELVASFVTVA